jgi:hypothetical protein
MTLDELRADLITAGVTAESPDRLGPEGERLAAEEHLTET